MARARLNALAAALEAIAAQLDDRGCRWALVGGLAVSARAEPRTTRDVDVVIATASDQEAELLAGDLRSSGYDIEAMLEDTRSHRLATVRLRPTRARTRSVVVDLLFASSGIEGEIVAAADALEIIRGLTVPVATVGHLIALKVLARDDRYRPQDHDDLRALTRIASKADLMAARKALALIHARGFDRDRDLVASLDAFMTSESGGSR
jgi:predicted nucleotidyltransferase